MKYEIQPFAILTRALLELLLFLERSAISSLVNMHPGYNVKYELPEGYLGILETIYMPFLASSYEKILY